MPRYPRPRITFPSLSLSSGLPGGHAPWRLPVGLSRVLPALMACLVLAATLVPDASRTAAASPLNDAIGIDFISNGSGYFTADRYRWAKEAGAAWNRWPMYWNEIELQPGQFDYSKPDATVAADTAQGLKILGILMSTPDWASTATTSGLTAVPPPPRVGQKPEPAYAELQAAGLQAASPATYPARGLGLPIFADGTDVGAPGKAINQDNLWARYVQRSVDRYKGRIKAWEVWNEADFNAFWNGTLEDYARLLKVAYTVIKATDPAATVVMGGMAFWMQQDFFPRLLAVINRDPAAAANGYYFDVTAWHWYSQADLLYDRTITVQQQMERAGIRGKKVWITETNLPVCEDPPMGDKNIGCSKGTHRGTPAQQADFVVQAIAYALAAGVERVFLFQLYDDNLGFGEYYGLVRNDGTPRPALQAAKFAAAQFQDITEAYRLTSARGRLELITMLTTDGRRLRLLWSRAGQPMSQQLPMEGAALLRSDGGGPLQPVAASFGQLYPLTLGPATLDDSGPGEAPVYIVGGPPVLLVEQQAQHQWTTLDGNVTDAAGRVLGGVQVRVGPGASTADGTGHYHLELRPGLYDVAMGRGPGPAVPGVYESVAIWGTHGNAQDVAVRTNSTRFLPLIPHR